MRADPSYHSFKTLPTFERSDAEEVEAARWRLVGLILAGLSGFSVAAFLFGFLL